MSPFAHHLLGLVLLGLALNGSVHAQLVWERIGPDIPAQSLQDVEIGERGKVYVRWAGDGGRERLFRSTDDGTTWSRVATDSVRGMLRVGPSGALHTIALRDVQGPTDVLTAVDLLRSTDDGLTWTRILNGPAGLYTSSGIGDVVFDESGAAHVSVPLYGPYWSSGAIYAQERYGSAWKTMGTEEATAIAVSPRGHSVVGVLDRDDTGILGASLLSRLSATDSLRLIRDSVLVSALHISDDWRIVAALAELQPGGALGTLVPGWTGIALSTGGRTWRRVAADVSVTQIVVAPDGSYYAVGFGELLRSSDLGESWEPLTDDSVRSISRLAVSPDGWLFAIANGSLYRARVTPADDRVTTTPQWTRVQGGLSDSSIWALDASSDGRLFAKTARRLTMSEDGGARWREIPLDSIEFVRAGPTGMLFGVVERASSPPTSTRDILYRSTDAGLSWTHALEAPGNWQYIGTMLSVLEFAGLDTVYAGYSFPAGSYTHNGAVYRSTDRGVTWRSQAGNGAVRAIAAGTPPWVATRENNDGGTAYSQVWKIVGDSALMARDSFFAVAAMRTHAGTVLLSGAAEHMREFAGPGESLTWHSEPGIYRIDGETWQLTLDSLWVDHFTIAADRSIIASGNAGIRYHRGRPQTWRSTDDGRTWSRFEHGRPYGSISGLAAANGAVYAGTQWGLYRVQIAPELTPRVRRPIERVRFGVPAKYAGSVPADKWVWVPKGWSVKVFHAGGLQQPRFLAWGPDSVLHVANLAGGRVLALPDRDGDGVADTSFAAASNVFAHDVEFFRGAMYAAEETRVLRLVDADGDGVYESRSVFIDGLPAGGHITRTIVFDTVRALVFVSVGSSCNACRDSVQAVVWAFDLDGGNRRIFASGVRNAVGLSLHPTTSQLWATNNGQDWQGDDVPPEWISIVRDGGFYGYPIAYSDQRYFDFQINEQYRGLLPITPADSAKVRSMRPFSAEVTAHSAPMAIEFADASMPEPYRDGAFVALHGSWNRSTPSGHTIVHLELDGPLDTIADAVSFVLSADTLEPGSPIDWLSPCGLESDARGNLYFTSDRGTSLIGVLTPPAGVVRAPIDATVSTTLRVIPNPALDRATIVVSIATPAHGVLELFDALGARVRIVADRSFTAGTHRVELDLAGLAAGAYQARLSVQGRIISTGVRVVR